MYKDYPKQIFFEGGLVNSGCHNKIPQTGCRNSKSFRTVLRLEA